MAVPVGRSEIMPDRVTGTGRARQRQDRRARRVRPGPGANVQGDPGGRLVLSHADRGNARQEDG
jgi:hypothetical protein